MMMQNRIVHLINPPIRSFTFIAAISLCILSGRLNAGEFRGVALNAQEISNEEVKKWVGQHYEIVCKLDATNHELNKTAARIVLEAQDHVSYLIEVARVPDIAKKHPDLMSSLQGHPEWRRFYPSFPKVKGDEVVKTFPWIPILHQEGMDLHLKRINVILSELPAPKTVWLNNIQGAPSSCGCGNTLCRWTSDYGPKKTTTVIGDDAPGQFLGKLAGSHKNIKFIPIFYPECEEGDKPHFCAGVGCYKGICWKAWSRQITGIAKHSRLIGAAAFFKDLDRTDPKYGKQGDWAQMAVEQFRTMPPKSGKTAWPGDRVISVLQGWNVTENQIENQIQASRTAGAKGHLLVKTKLDQSWRPMAFKYK